MGIEFPGPARWFIGALFAAACGGVERDILGNWYGGDAATHVEFFDDGRAAFTMARGAALAGNWTVLRDGRVKIEVASLGSTEILTGALRNDTLTLERANSAIRFVRATPELAARFEGAQQDSQYVEALRSSLKMLAVAQEAYFADYRTYSKNPSSYAPRSGVTVTVTTVSPAGWEATARHPSARVTCSIGFGRSLDGEIVCR